MATGVADEREVIDPRKVERDPTWGLPKAVDVKRFADITNREDLLVFSPFPAFASSRGGDRREFQRSVVNFVFRSERCNDVAGIEVIRGNISPFQVTFSNDFYPLASYLVLCANQTSFGPVLDVFSESVVPRFREDLTKMAEDIERGLNESHHKEINARTAQRTREFLEYLGYRGRLLEYIRKPEEDAGFLNACTGSIKGSHENIGEMAIALTAIYGGRRQLTTLARQLSKKARQVRGYQSRSTRTG
jgi:hypothetical protein